jgi:hypothetical protein
VQVDVTRASIENCGARFDPRYEEDFMSTNTDTSTRTLASFAAVLALLALVLCLVQSSRTGVIAQYAGITKVTSEANEAELLKRVSLLSARVDEMEAEMKAAAATPAPAAPAEEAEGGE